MPDPQRFVPTPYRPAWWLPGAHAQTVGVRLIPRGRGVSYRRERIDTPDGDFLDLDFATVDGAPAGEDAPLCVVVHGLEGSSGSSYVLETCRALARRGIRAVAMNYRSCSGEPNRAARLYHAGETGDLAHVLAVLGGRFPRARLLAIGFSLGANMLLKYLGERGADAVLTAAAAVSIPFDLGMGADKLWRSFMGRRYTLHFVRKLQGKFAAKREQLSAACDAERVMAARSFREFDDAATARIHGFRDAVHYYESQSCAQFLPGIRVPTLLLHAYDDPFVDERAIPHDAIRANPCLRAAFTKRGGHVGFIAGSPRDPAFWAEAEAARFLALQAGTEPA
ncbi:MAG TPA: alpha/beta fold hydrolase [Longimicrobium sp.]|nr:alpha/beta fold hydrolase [Longimicrobium sp.]